MAPAAQELDLASCVYPTAHPGPAPDHHSPSTCCSLTPHKQSCQQGPLWCCSLVALPRGPTMGQQMDLWSLQNNGGGGALASPSPNRKRCMSFKELAGLRGWSQCQDWRLPKEMPASLGCPACSGGGAAVARAAGSWAEDAVQVTRAGAG